MLRTGTSALAANSAAQQCGFWNPLTIVDFQVGKMGRQTLVDTPRARRPTQEETQFSILKSVKTYEILVRN